MELVPTYDKDFYNDPGNESLSVNFIPSSRLSESGKFPVNVPLDGSPIVFRW